MAAAAAASKAAREGRTEAEEEQRDACQECFERGWRCIFSTALVIGYGFAFLTFLVTPYPSELWYHSLHDERIWKDAVKRVDCADVSASGTVLLNCELDEHGSHTQGPGAFRNHTHAGVGLRVITEVLQCVESCSYYARVGGPAWLGECTHRIEWKGDDRLLRGWDTVQQTDSESFKQSCGAQNPELSRNDTDFPFSGTYFAESIGVGSFKVMTKAAVRASYYSSYYSWYDDDGFRPYGIKPPGFRTGAQSIPILLDLPVEWPAPLPEGWEPAVETHDGQRRIVYYRKPAHPSGVLVDGYSIGTIRTRFMSNDWKRKDVTVVGEVTEWWRSNKTVIEFRSRRSMVFWFTGLWAGTWSEDELWKRLHWGDHEPYFTLTSPRYQDNSPRIVFGFFCAFWAGHLVCSVPCLFCMDPRLSFRQVVASAVMACAPALAVVLSLLAWPWIAWTQDWWIGLLLALSAVALCSIRCCCYPRNCVVLTPCTQRCLEAVKPMSSKPMGKQPSELEVPPSNEVSQCEKAKLVMCRVVGASHNTTEAPGAEAV